MNSDDKNDDQGRRKFLVTATGCVGCACAAATAYPFISSMSPSERALAAGAPVKADIGHIDQGSLIVVGWRSKPVWIMRRTPEQIAGMTKHNSLLVDPNSEVDHQPSYCKNPYRSIKPEIFVAVGICTHLGCSPNLDTGPAAKAALGPNWPGGFLCPCHGSKYDLAGRVFKNVPAPTNLVIPRHRYLSATRIIIGEDNEKKA